jgi:hypothetical protein
MIKLLILCSTASLVCGCGSTVGTGTAQPQPVSSQEDEVPSVTSDEQTAEEPTPAVDSPDNVPGLLTLDDISDLPEGTARGTEFAGRTYEFVSDLVSDCDCMVDETPNGFCSNFSALPSDGSVVRVQQDGGFISFEQLTLSGDLANTSVPTGPGTLNADGTWILGSVSRVFDTETDETVGQQLILADGRLTDALMTFHAVRRIQAVKDGVRVDCRLETDGIYRRTDDSEHNAEEDISGLDFDSDGVPDGTDNCWEDYNPTQVDVDGDSIGDACEPDVDLDGVADDVDNCGLFNPDQTDADNNGVGDACDVDVTPARDSCDLQGDVIQSTIVSDFSGFAQGNIYELLNGQYWQQVDFLYRFDYAFYPTANLVRVNGEWQMTVDGIDESVAVECLRVLFESYVAGSTTGFDGSSVFELENGQVWEQTEFYYYYHYAYRPKVVIFDDGQCTRMKVDGIERAVCVQQVN